MQWATSDTGEDGFRMTSKAWPEARFLMALMSMSACVCINRKESLCVTFHSSMFDKGNKNRSLPSDYHLPSKSPMMFLLVSGYRQEQMNERTEISFIFSL